MIAEPATQYGVPRNTFTGYNTDRDRNDTDIVTMKLAHQATPWLTLSNDTRAAAYSRYFQYTTIDRCDFTVATNFCSDVLFGQARIRRRQRAPPIRGTPKAVSAAAGHISRTAGVCRTLASAKADFNVGGFAI